MTIKLAQLLQPKTRDKEHWLNKIFVVFSQDEDQRLIDQDTNEEIPLAPLPSQYKVKVLK